MNERDAKMYSGSIREISRRIRSIEMQLAKSPTIPVAARYTHNDAIVLSRGVPKVINYDDEVYDTDSAVTPGALTWNFEVPAKKNGVYIVIACISSYPTADVRANDDRLEVQILINSVLESRFPDESQISSSSNTYSLHALGIDIFNLDEGDTIQIKGLYEGLSGTTITLNEDANLNFVAIGRMR